MPTVTLGDLKARVYHRLDENTTFYTSTEVTRAINNGVRVLNLLTGFLQNTATVTTVADQYLYTVPAGILVPLRIDIDDVFLDKENLLNLCNSHPNWMLETTATTEQEVSKWCPVGIDRFVIHPADAIGGRTMDVTGVEEPSLLVSDSDVIGYPNEFADAIEDYAAHTLMIKAGGIVAVQAMHAFQAFMRRANELKRFKAKIAPTFRIEVEAPK